MSHLPHPASRHSVKSRVIAIAAAAACAIGFGASTATAASIDATSSVSASTVSRGSTLNAQGSVTYRPDVWGYVVPMTGYIQQTYSYYRFARPSVVSTNWGNNPSFYKGTDDSSGSTVWRASNQFNFFGELTVSQKSKAAASTSGSAVIRYGTGKGHTFDRNSWEFDRNSWENVTIR